MRPCKVMYGNSEVRITKGVIECLKSHSHSLHAKQCLLTNGSHVMTYSEFCTVIDAIIWVG